MFNPANPSNCLLPFENKVSPAKHTFGTTSRIHFQACILPAVAILQNKTPNSTTLDLHIVKHFAFASHGGASSQEVERGSKTKTSSNG